MELFKKDQDDQKMKDKGLKITIKICSIKEKKLSKDLKKCWLPQGEEEKNYLGR